MRQDFIIDKKVLNVLESDLKNGLSHAYLFSGPRGIGKFQTAINFVNEALCGCSDIGFCRDSKDHPDLVVLKSDGIKKADIEKVIELAAVRPYEANFKFIVIDDFQEATKEAQNAFLKTLEEPSRFIKAILISQRDEEILPTIISRCKRINFSPVRRDSLIRFLRQRGADQNAELFADICGGSVARALDFFEDPKYLSLRSEIFKLLDELNSSDASSIFEGLEFFKTNRDEISFLFDMIDIFYRDILFLSFGLEDRILNRDKLSLLKRQSIDYTKALKISSKLIETKRDLKYNINYDLAIQSLLIEMGGHT